MKKLLWVGDAGVPSGFARSTHEVLDTLRYVYDVTVLGINYRGDPHEYPYPMYAAGVEGDAMGILRLIWMCDLVKPDVIVLQNDGWNIQPYIQRLRRRKANGEYEFPEHAAIPVVAVVAVDGKNFQGGWLQGVEHAIFWTQFALDEARKGGYKGEASVIPLGVNLEIYRPIDRETARKRLPETLYDAPFRNAFIVGNVNRNQSRKRLDLTVKYFAEWIKSKGIKDAWLYMHVAPTGENAVNVRQLMHYYGVLDRLAEVSSQAFYGVPEEQMALTYNCFDLNISTTQAEGFGLPALEAMACQVPPILPDSSAYGDWARSGAWLVPCTDETIIGEPYVNVIGAVPDQRKFIEALHALYSNKEARENNARAALETAQQDRYRWANIGQSFLDVIDGVLYPTVGVAEPAQAQAGEGEWLKMDTEMVH